MAPDIVEEPDYESDPEELKRSLATRRREASNDEEDTEIHRGNQRPEIDSDDDDEEEGPPIDGEDSYDEEEEEEDDDDMVEYIADNDKASALGKNTDGRNGEDATEDSATDVVDGEEQKKEPFAVPTAGAFYMHDHRFQEMDAASNRRMRGGRRLWQSRDERKWGHDKYEEMNTHEKQYDVIILVFSPLHKYIYIFLQCFYSFHFYCSYFKQSAIYNMFSLSLQTSHCSVFYISLSLKITNVLFFFKTIRFLFSQFSFFKNFNSF